MDYHDFYQIRSNQVVFSDVKLKSTIRKYCAHPYKRPISARAMRQFDYLLEHLHRFPRPIIVDSGCGKGKSSQILAQSYPDHLVIAIDQSEYRLRSLRSLRADNIYIVQENCIDFWRLLSASDLTIDMHLLLYPNPWPKKRHENRRWYAHPIAPLLLNMSRLTIMRSNWLAYLQASAVVANQLGLCHSLESLSDLSEPLSHFEAKYCQHHIPLYQLKIINV